MAEWRDRAEVIGDVVFFSYAKPELEKQVEEVFVWDLDKTYLDTKFESLRGLVRTALEKAFQKKNVPGTASLALALKDYVEDKYHYNRLAIYFITASPPQLEAKIHEKVQLDGIEPFGIFCKDNMQNLRPKRLWRLTKQVGYKLQALLQMRLRLKENVRQILWGDDSESDAVIYSLYSDICARRREKEELVAILQHFHVVGSQMDTIFDLQSQIPINDPVEKIYINLADDTDSEYYLKFGRRLMPSFNSFQTALDLHQDGRLGFDQLLSVAQDMMVNFEFTRDEFEWSIDDLVRRKILSSEVVDRVLPQLKEHGIIHKLFNLSMTPKPAVTRVDGRVYELEGTYEPWVPPHIDYTHDYR